MLVLTRKKGERIRIGGSTIVVEILQIKGSTVKIGVHADKDISIVRGELEYTPKEYKTGEANGMEAVNHAQTR